MSDKFQHKMCFSPIAGLGEAFRKMKCSVRVHGDVCQNVVANDNGAEEHHHRGM